MTVAATVHWECRSGGNDDNGGGFNQDAAGTDYSQQDAAQYSGTNLTVDGVSNTKVVPDGHTPVAADVGNCIQITAGAGFSLAWYEITSQDGTSWTLDRTPAATSTSGGTWAMGGALATPGKASSVFTTGQGGRSDNTIWIKSAIYTLTNSTPATSGGPFAAINTSGFTVEGYETTRGDKGAKPTLNAGSQTNLYLWHQDFANQSTYRNLKADGNSQTGVEGFKADYNSTRWVGCEAVNCDATTTTRGFVDGQAIGCVAIDCGYGYALGCNIYNCKADSCASGFHSCSGSGFLAVNCTTYGVYASTVDNTSRITCDGCATGLYMTGSYANATSVIVSGCTTGVTDVGADSFLQAVAYYNNTSDGTEADYHDQVYNLTADPYTNSAGGDYSLNADAGGGADIQGDIFGQLQGYIGAIGPAGGGGAGGGGGELSHPLGLSRG